MSANNKPAAKVTVYPVSAAIWRNQTEKGVLYSVTFQRSYKDDDGKWKNSDSYGKTELLIQEKVCQLAFAKVLELEQNDLQQHSNED